MAGNSPSSSLADTGIKFVDILGKIAGVALRADKTIEQVDAIISPLAGLIPYYSQVMTVLRDADPILSKIVQYAPVAEQAIDAGRPAIEWVQASAPQIMPQVTQLIAIARAKGMDGLIGAATQDAVAALIQHMLVGRPWTPQELKVWQDKAVGDS